MSGHAGADEPAGSSGALDPSWGCPILHVDMDAFYASVALRDRPDLADRPVVAGGGSRGVVLSANYAARRYGIHSAMPITRARRLCPDLVSVSPDFDTVSAVSQAVMENFRRISPVIEVVSLDEAYLDVRGATRRLGSPRQVAELVRSLIHDEQRITCSVGVAPSVPVAKIASRRAKPDGVVVVPPERVIAFLHPLDVGELWGVGPTTRRRLHALGLVTVADVAAVPLEELRARVGEHLGRSLHALARGEGRDHLRLRTGPFDPDRSMGAQQTFGRDLDEPDAVARELLRLAAKVTRRMRAAAVAGRTVTLTVRFADFRTITRSRTLPEATDGTQEVYRAALASLVRLDLGRRRLRLVGVRVEGLRPRAEVHHQLALDEPAHGWSDADRAVDAAARRFGAGAVRPAALVEPRPAPGTLPSGEASVAEVTNLGTRLPRDQRRA